MSVKNNAMVAVAALALGVTVTAGANPVCEGLLNDFTVTNFGFAEVDSQGRVLVIVSVDTGTGVEVRPVADQQGHVRLYASADGAVMLAKKCQMAANTVVTFRRFISTGTVGDPITALKSKFKAAKAEETLVIKQQSGLAAKLTAAEALGWDEAVGTPENLEYLDLQDRAASLTEWKTKTTAKKTALAASLTAAGVDPLTVV